MKNYRFKVLFFLENVPSNSILSALLLFVRQFQMPLGGLSVVKTLATFGTIYATDPKESAMTQGQGLL